jgi:hypothetical protein
MVFVLRDYEKLIMNKDVLEIMDNQEEDEEFLWHVVVFHVHHIYMMTKPKNN